MNKLLLTINEDIRKRNLNKKIIAEQLPITAAALGKNLNGGSAFDFFNYLNLVEVLYKDEEEMQRDRIEQFFWKNKKPNNFKYMFEWATNNGEHQLSNILIKRLKEDNYYASSSYMYKLLQERISLIDDGMTFLSKTRDIRIGSEEVVESRSLKNIVDIYALWDLKAYTAIEPHANIAMEFLHENVSNSYAKDSHELRILEMKLSGMIKRNNRPKVEKTIREIFQKENLKRFPIQINSIYLTIAEYYSAFDFELSKEYLQKSFEIPPKYLHKHKKRKRSLEATHDYIHISNESYDSLFLNDKAETAFYFAKIGNKEEALKILGELEIENNGLSPHQKFYKGLALNNKKIIKESFDDFVYLGDIFYAQIVERYLF
jgi:hypothetical protein